MKETERNLLQTTLQKSFLFEGLPENFAEQFSNRSQIELKTFRSGEEIDQPATSRSLAIVASGKLRVFGMSEGQSVLLNTLTEGNAFGVATIFTEDPSPVSRIISSGTSQVFYIPKNIVVEMLSSDSRVALNYITFMSERVRFLNHKIGQYTAKTVEGRLEKFFLSCPMDKNGDITLAMSLIKIANHLSISRASLYRVMELMEDENIIKRRNKQLISILNLDELINISERN